MSFLFPKAPKPVAAPTTAMQATPTEAEPSSAVNPGSMISTSSQGLTRKARTIKPSLIGSSASGN